MPRIGMKFKPTFRGSGIDHFEVRGYDKERDMVLTTCFPKDGRSSFPDEIEKVYFDAAFEIGEYVVLDE